MKLAVVGATGLVGREMLKVIEERNFGFDELYLVASPNSAGKKITFKCDSVHAYLPTFHSQLPLVFLISSSVPPSL